MNYKWKYAPPSPEEEEAARKLGGELGIHPVLARLLQDRCITNVPEAKKFFHPQLSDLHDPFLMNDMDVAVDAINGVIGRGERILVFGDYDVDGCTAVTVVYSFLRHYSTNIGYYIPDRYDEGYGLSKRCIDDAAATRVKLMIVLDCGIKSIEEVAYANSLGIDVIICDHHVPDPELPAALAVLNPKRKDSTYPYSHLSGCGVGFKLMQAFAQNNGIAFNKLIPLLDLCVISIAGDIVPVTGENRILAYHGLRRLNSCPSTGVQAIIELCSLEGKELTMNDIVFKIGPRINASGRMMNGKETVALLTEKEHDSAIERAGRINLYNEVRKDIDKQMTEEAGEIVDGLKNLSDLRSLVVYNPSWHKGVVGIVASRLTELYYRPAVVLTLSDGYVTGSARSVAGFDIYKAIESCRDLLENFGGHTYAVGLTMRPENVPAFKDRFEKYVEEHIREEQTEASIDISAVIDFRDITKKFRSDLKRFNPFGPGNPKPIFCTKHVYDYGTSKVVGREQEHIKLELVDDKSNTIVNGIAFGQSSQARYIKTKRAFDICYTIEENTHRHGEMQLQIEDIRPAADR
jgi:single-stranded-DNA-specific exonuclease